MRGIMQKMPRVDARRVGRERNRINAGGDDGDGDGRSRFDLLVAERDVMREPKVFLEVRQLMVRPLSASDSRSKRLFVLSIMFKNLQSQLQPISGD